LSLIRQRVYSTRGIGAETTCNLKNHHSGGHIIAIINIMPSNLKTKNHIGLRERKKRLTRSELLSVAGTLFAENDFSQVTIEQIVDMANVSPKTFFNYFQNKSQFLEEYMLDWLKGIGFWSFSDRPVKDCRSSLIPPDATETLDWIIEHRRILKMALQHTDFFNFIYKLEQGSSVFDPNLHSEIRRPRLERVLRGQVLGVVRKDISADEICNIYDALRIDTVRRWLYLPDAEAKPEMLHQNYETIVVQLLRAFET